MPFEKDHKFEYNSDSDDFDSDDSNDLDYIPPPEEEEEMEVEDIRKRKEPEYDLEDDFIDDSELPNKYKQSKRFIFDEEIIDDLDSEEFDPEDVDGQFIMTLRDAIKNTITDYLIHETDTFDENEKKKLKEAIEEKERLRPDKLKIIRNNMSIEDTIHALEDLDLTEDPGVNPIDRLRTKRKLIKYIKNNKDSDNLKKRKIEFENEIGLTSNLLLRVINCKQSVHNKKIIYEHYKEYFNGSSGSTESKALAWINVALRIPTEPCMFPNNSLNLLSIAKTRLDKEVYGMQNAKKEILKLLYNKMCGINTNRFLTLVGPPGTGKTSILQIVCKEIDLPFHKINVGGMESVCSLNGHSFTYEGAMPGLIVSNIMRTKYNNGILFFDEIDKISQSEKGVAVQSCLLHILDGSQNSSFQDMYLKGMEIDLSNYTFVLSANYLDRIPYALRDRLHIVEIDGYEYSDKVEIVTNWFWPKYCEKYNINPKLTEIICKKLVSLNHEAKSGVRQLERDTENLINTLLMATTNPECAEFEWTEGDPVTVEILEKVIKKKKLDLYYPSVYL